MFKKAKDTITNSGEEFTQRIVSERVKTLDVYAVKEEKGYYIFICVDDDKNVLNLRLSVNGEMNNSDDAYCCTNKSAYNSEIKMSDKDFSEVDINFVEVEDVILNEITTHYVVDELRLCQDDLKNMFR